MPKVDADNAGLVIPRYRDGPCEGADGVMGAAEVLERPDVAQRRRAMRIATTRS
jgi:hypothetical protein